MKLKTQILLLFICFFLSIISSAKNSRVKNTDYITIEGIGVRDGLIKDTPEHEFVIIGGLVNIKTTELFNESNIRSRAYYISDCNKNRRQNSEPFSNQIFLNVGNEYVIELSDKKTNKLLRRYRISRIRSVPQIKMLAPRTDDLKFNFTLGFSDDVHSNISLSSNVTNVELEKAMDDTLDVEYRLTDLSTKKKISSGVLQPGEMLNVNSDTEYELRYNYLAQPETNGVKYIKIKPHWYQSIIIYSIFFLSLTTFGFYIITWKFRKKIKSSEAQQNKLEEEAMRLQSMLNPHFTFNALNSIQGLMNTGRTGEANTYLEEFGMLLRKSLSKNKDLFNSLDQELDMMRIYLRIEALRFDFQWEIIVSDVLHIAEIEIPTLLLQPLVENAVKHGVSSLKEQGQLIITCREEKNDLIIMIEDNGAWNSKTFVTGYGLALTHERIHTINTIQKDEQIFLSIDIDKGTGTQVILTFKNWLDI
ncbi:MULTISPECIES: sensor histidine kinase [Chryseobacterium]|jgi:hypothetical protein|uniref:sensor histidine kinase n=1 Tax=Chryseobacterium TaxID=59732 RepID=UPI001AE8A362|nr:MULTISPECIES: histidine kinase [Chryseobacterium]MBP1164623.1 hypothetical protein [Chryseobacterium sp. PvR013]MDR6461570.1 hypothetical protein [Chryseobacterium sediminis]